VCIKSKIADLFSLFENTAGCRVPPKKARVQIKSPIACGSECEKTSQGSADWD